MELILKPIRAEKAEKRRKLFELERLLKTGGNEYEIKKLRDEVSGKRNDTFDEELFEGRTKEHIEEEKEIAKLALRLKPKRNRVTKNVGVWDKWKEVAESNGVHYEQFMQRIRRDWTCEEAASNEIRQSRRHLWEKWEEKCVKNNVDYHLFVQRVNKGWEPEEASEARKRVVKKEGWLKWKEVAESNGVTYNAFFGRVNKGMDPEEAASKPVWNNGRKK